MKRTEPKSFAEIFDEGMRLAGAADTLAQQRACYLWPEIVGPGVNKYTLRRYVDGGVLHVYITSAPLKQELQFLRSGILEQLNKAVGCQALTSIEIH